MTIPFEKNIAVVVGIDEYSDGIPQLHSAVNDAKRIGNILVADHDYEQKPLFNSNATLHNINQLLDEWLPQNIGENDRVLVYFAGHGLALDADDGPRGYLLMHDSTRDDVHSYLEMSVLHDKLMALPCRHMLIILDSCFAGAFRWSSSRDMILMPGVLHQEAYERFIADPAWQLLTSAAHDQTAADQLFKGSLGSRGESETHSPFALALFDALDGKADLVPEGGDGIITATELYLYLESRLQPETINQGRRQTPGLWPLKRHNKGEYIFEVKGRQVRLPPAPELSVENNPYQGLNAYDSGSADLFFGRTKVIEDLALLIQTHALIIVLGASGSGKSSLVKAGLVPLLEASDWDLVGMLRPGLHPLPALENALKKAQKNRHKKQLLVIDQFEELVTMTRNVNERDAVLALLHKALTAPDCTLHVVLTLRADFETHFQSGYLGDFWQKGRFTVPPLSREELREVIEQPAAERVLYFEPSALVDRILDDVIAMPGALPLLSFTLSEMYLRYLSASRGDRALTEQDYEDLGCVAGALKTRADAEYETLDTAHRNTFERLMLRMLQFEHGLPVRQRISADELKHWSAEEDKRIAFVVEQFCSARLLVKGIAEDNNIYVEPAHDALITSWTKLLSWAAQLQASEPDLNFLHALSHNATSWAQASLKTKPGLLWRDKVRSDRLWALRKYKPLLLNQQENEFCRLSVRRQRLIRSITIASVAAIIVSGVVATGFGIVANTQRIEAVAQRDEARRQTITANSNALTASISSALDGQNNPSIALKIAKKALEVNPNNEQAPWLVRRAVYGQGIIKINGRPYARPLYFTVSNKVAEASWSPSGNYIVTYGINNETTIYYKDGTLKATIDTDAYGIGNFSADENYYIDYNEQAWRISGEKTRQDFQPPIATENMTRQQIVAEGYNTAWYHAWSQDEQIRAGHGALDAYLDVYVSNEDFADFQIVKNGQVINTISGVWNMPALSPKGNLLATANYDGEVVLWQITGNGKQATQLSQLWKSQQSYDVWSMAFSPDGSQLLVGMRGGILRVWDLTWNPLSINNKVFAELKDQNYEKSNPRMEATLDDTNASNDTPFYIINAKDKLSNNTWVAEVTASSVSIQTLDDMLIISNNDGFALYDVKGVSRLNIPRGNHLLSAVHVPGHLILEPYEIGEALAIPVDPFTILDKAEKRGLLDFSDAEIAAWNIESLTQAQAPKTALNANEASMLTRIGRQLTDLLWEDSFDPDGDSNDSAPSVNSQVIEIEKKDESIPYLWEQIAISNEPDIGTFYSAEEPGNIRWYLSNVKSAGIPRILASMGAPQAFLSGPHSLQDWNVHRSESGSFGHYNPEFLAWLDINLLPSDNNSTLLQATQIAYDTAIKNMIRVHAIALTSLESHPELQQKVLSEYLSIENGHNYYILEVMNDAAMAIGEHPEGKTREFSFAMGFWIRRELDGTKEQFRGLMDKTLKLYDPEFYLNLDTSIQLADE